jgi:hypothetical protein
MIDVLEAEEQRVLAQIVDFASKHAECARLLVSDGVSHEQQVFLRSELLLYVEEMGALGRRLVRLHLQPHDPPAAVQ